MSNNGIINIDIESNGPLFLKSNNIFLLYSNPSKNIILNSLEITICYSTIFIAKTEKMKPIIIEPVSPINIFAGYLLNIKNDIKEPIKAHDMKNK